MLILPFGPPNNRHALAARCIVEVLPYLSYESIPDTPPFVCGRFSYHGPMVPTIDIHMLLGYPACKPCLGTRTILVSAQGKHGDYLLGLLAEGVTNLRETPQITPNSPLKTPAGSVLGRLVSAEGHLFQMVEINHLLDEKMQAMLLL